MMKAWFYLIAALLVFTANTACAAEVYIKKNPDSALPPPITSAPPATATPQTGTAAPQGADMKTSAETYYSNCLLKKHPLLDDDSQKKLCACTAGRFMQSMTMDEIKTMQDDTPQGQLNRNKMLLQVYTPCIEFPAYAMVNTSCVNNPQIRAFPNYQTICSCVSTGMAGYVRTNAPATIETALRENAANLDPLRAMLESPGFNQAADTTLQGCIMGKTP